MRATKLSVVIGTYNQRDTVQNILEGYTSQTASRDAFEVVVIDSESIDGTDEAIESLKVPYSLRYFRQENRGKGAARNRGIKEAVGDVILLTDGDMYPEANLIQAHLDAHAKHAQTAFEGRTYNLRSLERGFHTPDNLVPYIQRKMRPFQKLGFHYFLTGNLSISKATLEKYGSFDEAFTGYGWEDLELGYRLERDRFPLRYLPNAINYHLHDLTAQHAPEKKMAMGESAAYFLKKHPHLSLKYFLGANPFAMLIYRVIAGQPRWEKVIKKNATHGRTWKWLYSEFLYRKGLSRGAAKLGIRV